jgi:Golgi nucleoside diphosphatase
MSQVFRTNSSGFIDMGGASAQVAFAPNATESRRHAEDLTLLRLRTLDGIEKEYRVFVSTWLGYGANEARRRYVQDLETHSKTTNLLRDPCLPKDLRLPVVNPTATLLGTGSLSECLNLQTPLLAKDMDCHDDPCLFGGVHAPALDFDVNHFIGVSEYWHTTHDVFDMGGTYDYATYSAKVEEFCARDWDSISADLKRHKWGKKLDEEKVRMVCFKAAWMMNVLHDGFGVPRLSKEFDAPPSSSHNSTQDLLDSAKSHGFTQPFTSVERIAGVEVSWTLGKMVLYSSSTVNSASGPLEEGDDTDAKYMVGFGPNNAHLYTDGEFYAPSGLVVPVASSGALGRLTESFAVSRRIPGLLLILTMIGLVAWLVIGKDKRNKILSSTTRKWFKKRRKVMGASGVYERLEAGEGEEDDYEDAIGSRAWALQELKPPMSSASGHASPHLEGAASSLERSESRERLPSRPVSRSDYRGRRQM